MVVAGDLNAQVGSLDDTALHGNHQPPHSAELKSTRSPLATASEVPVKTATPIGQHPWTQTMPCNEPDAPCAW
ncbi:unnamed protein product [Echinostoma caproni]|uniref:Uncharacterized protein n=1 Tax=Echinostoma caproni TaxID=27848 RepID=A0A183AFJ5_9TREM|nr:unnamed protein product [Echinostoma caproni]